MNIGEIKPKVSIGLPVYNGEKTIKKSINSLLSQTFRDFELIISDNASDDETSNICKGFSLKDPRIKYIRQKKILVLVKISNMCLKKLVENTLCG